MDPLCGDTTYPMAGYASIVPGFDPPPRNRTWDEGTVDRQTWPCTEAGSTRFCIGYTELPVLLTPSTSQP